MLEVPPRRVRRIALTPLIDVVFLLLVFFMLASTFLKFSSVTIAGGTAAPGVAVKPQETALVRIHPDGKIEFNTKTVDVTTLIAELDSFAAQGGARALLKPLKGTTVQDVVKVMETVRRSQIKRVVIVR